jgi:hypothetical protein
LTAISLEALLEEFQLYLKEINQKKKKNRYEKNIFTIISMLFNVLEHSSVCTK